LIVRPGSQTLLAQIVEHEVTILAALWLWNWKSSSELGVDLGQRNTGASEIAYLLEMTLSIDAATRS
jgi:hypothetical protein